MWVGGILIDCGFFFSFMRKEKEKWKHKKIMKKKFEIERHDNGKKNVCFVHEVIRIRINCWYFMGLLKEFEIFG